MYAEIIKIGNSKGLRIPKVLLEQCKLENTVQLTIKNQSLIITPYKSKRIGWDKSFQSMAKNKDDYLLDEDELEYSWNLEKW